MQERFPAYSDRRSEGTGLGPPTPSERVGRTVSTVRLSDCPDESACRRLQQPSGLIGG
jgi:hypothetical protein